MLDIAVAESNLENIPNTLYTDEEGRYTAYGTFQINRSTYTSYCGEDYLSRFNIIVNIDCAMTIATTSGYHHWCESYEGWKEEGDGLCDE